MTFLIVIDEKKKCLKLGGQRIGLTLIFVGCLSLNNSSYFSAIYFY